MENAIAQAHGIDYMTSSSGQNISNIQVNLLLNYDPDKALTEVNTQVGTALNQLPRTAQFPTLKITVGESIASMYIGFYSDYLQSNQINDYILRVVQPKLQAINGVQQASIIGNYQFALRAWLDPKRMAGYGITPAEVAQKLQQNDFVSASGRTDGQIFVRNFSTNTNMTSVKEFKNLIVKTSGDAVVRLKDIAKVTMGSQNYNTKVYFNGKPAIYVSITVVPGANLLDVMNEVRSVFKDLKSQMPTGLNAGIVYDASLFVNSSITEVNHSLLEAFLIVTLVVFLFLGSFRSLIIPVIAIPLSLVGTFFIMLLLSYSINLLTLLALVLAIGLVVDDAIIVVENVHRHIDEGVHPMQAAMLSARELTMPIVAITVVLIAVYLPIGFMGGLTGALFTEFAFTLAAAVTVSAVIALTLSPLMCSRMLKENEPNKRHYLMDLIDRFFNKLANGYKHILNGTLKYLSVTIVFSIIILGSNYFLFVSSKSELAPKEDQGIILAQLTSNGNSSLNQTATYTEQVAKIFHSYPFFLASFAIVGTTGAIAPPQLNGSISGMVLKPWDQRKKSTNQIKPEMQLKMNFGVSGANVALFQPPPLPGGGSGLPIQFVIETTQPFSSLNEVTEQIIDKARKSGKFAHIDTDLKYDQQQARIVFNRDKIAQFGLTMKEVSDSLTAMLSENYVNYFNFMGRSYQVIPEVTRQSRLNEKQILNYYIKTREGKTVSLDTIAHLEHKVVPENINHFQQLNSATISAIAMPFVSMGDALAELKKIAEPILPQGYTYDYAAQSRQFIQEGSSLLITFFLALIVIYLSLAVLFNSFRDPFIVLISVPMSICGAMIFISIGIGNSSLNIYTEVGLITLIGLISKHGILIVQFANDLQAEGKKKLEAILEASAIRLRPILMTTAAMVLGVTPLIMAAGAGAVSRFNIGLVIATGISIGTLFTLFVVPAMYLLFAHDLGKKQNDLVEA